MMSDFHHQQAARGQMRGRLAQNDTHRIEAIGAAGQRKRRLVTVLKRQSAHDGRADIGRVGDDQIVAFGVQCRKHV